MLVENKNIDLKVDLHKVHAELCRRSFFYFVQFFWDTIIAEEPIWNWHIKYLCSELQTIGLRVALLDRGRKDSNGDPVLERLHKEFDYIIINVPPGSSKSTIISEMYPLWCWAIDASQRFICGSYASTPAEDIAEKCFNVFNSDKFQAVFPELHKRSSGGKTHFKNGLRGERYTTSTGSGITGIHAHQKIIDDPMSPAIAASKIERERANKWVSETIGSRNVNADVTVTIIVMQRLHEEDTTGYLLNKAKEGLKIKHVCIPAELSSDVKPVELRTNYVNGLFDPVRRSKQSLQKVKAELGTYGYSGQMQQRPSPEEGGILKKAWFRIINRTGLPAYKVPHFQLDTAYTDEEKNDPTAVVCYYREEHNVVIYNRQSVWMEFPELIEWLPEFLKMNGYTKESKIYVEPKASGKSVVQVIKKGTDLNIIESECPKDDKLTRVYTASPKIEAGRVWIHSGLWSEPFLDQVTSFPTAKHDDETDCLTAIVKRELMAEPGSRNKNLSGMFH
jgi:predicted phage terminase large subunit-like protein